MRPSPILAVIKRRRVRLQGGRLWELLWQGVRELDGGTRWRWVLWELPWYPGVGEGVRR